MKRPLTPLTRELQRDTIRNVEGSRFRKSFSLNTEDFFVNPIQFFKKLRNKTTTLNSFKSSVGKHLLSALGSELGFLSPVCSGHLEGFCNIQHVAAKPSEKMDRKLPF